MVTDRIQPYTASADAAVNHAGILHIIFAQKKPLKIKGTGYVRCRDMSVAE
jgi:hypothetical protein